MGDLSRTFRRVISTKRNGLKILYSEVAKISDNTNGLSVDASADECHMILLEISRIRKKLESSIEVIKSNAKKWESAIEELENEDEKSTEWGTLTQYFTDSSTESNSITAIESDVIEQIHALAAEESSLTRIMKSALSRNENLRGASAIPKGNMNITHAERMAPVSITQIPLPQLSSLTLPKFKGKDNYKDYWTTFSDLIDKKDLGDTTKQRYFESSLEGEALDLLRHFPVRFHGATRYTKSHVPFEAKAYGSEESSKKPKAQDWKEKSHERPIAVAAGSDRIRMLTGSAKLVNPEDGRTENADIFLDCGSAVTQISEKPRSKLGLQTIRRETFDLTGVGGRSDGIEVYEVVHVSLPTNTGSIEMDAVVHPEPLTCALPQANLTSAYKKVRQKMKTTMAQPIQRVSRVTPYLLTDGKQFNEVTGIASERLPSGLLTVPRAIGRKIFDNQRDLLRVLWLDDPFKPPPIQTTGYLVIIVCRITWWSFARLLVRKRANRRQKYRGVLIILTIFMIIQEVRICVSRLDSESEICTDKTCQKFVKSLAMITCGRDSLSLCSMEGETQRIMAAEQAQFHQMCTVSCGNPVEIHGILKCAGVLTKPEDLTESLKGDKNSTIDFSSLPDFSHITSVFLSYWMRTLLMIVTVGILMFFTIYFLIPAIPCIIQMIFCCRRICTTKIPRKEL